MCTSPSSPTPIRAVVLALVCSAALTSGAPLHAQPPEETFGEEKRITAIDLVVAFETGAVREWATDDHRPNYDRWHYAT